MRSPWLGSIVFGSLLSSLLFAADPPGAERFKVPTGFRVETVIPPKPTTQGLDGKLPFSLVNMTFDAKGRLLASQERGPVLLCTDPDAKGELKTIRPYCTLIKNCQGLCWVKGHLLMVGDGPQGVGLYRGTPDDKTDTIAKVEQLHKFRGGMGEHGPHAIVHGPDDKLYFVIGNHAWATVDKLAEHSPLVRWPTGAQGPDQGKPNTTEDVLLPRLNDARGHAANILAPGGTIWRCDLDGKNLALVAAGFRNHYDAAFNPAGELFTFDSDMEWDENLPWYRHVRVCHCTPGSDFVWRTGAANTPNYYLDSLPPTAETGRGSPVGVTFCDSPTFGAKYRGAFMMADWSIGTIWAVHLKRAGASYQATTEKFCTGTPMNVTDLEYGPDGALYFTLGGRGTAGGVYRIVGDAKADTKGLQPLAAWSPMRAKHPLLAEPAELSKLLQADDPEVRANAVWQIGVKGDKTQAVLLAKALADKDAWVRRRTLEAYVQLGVEPPLAVLAGQLNDHDPFVRTAARLCLQRVEPKKWAPSIETAETDRLAHEAIVALCKIHQAEPYAEVIFRRLHDHVPSGSVQGTLDWARCVQLALIHTTTRPDSLRGIAVDCREMFPHADARVNRELAILLAEFSRTKVLHDHVTDKLLAALSAAKDDRAQQIHYFYCLRVVKAGWTAAQKAELLTWFDSTSTWTGGASFVPFLDNILRDLNSVFTPEDRQAAFAQLEQHPKAAIAMLNLAEPSQLPPPATLVKLYERISQLKLKGGNATLLAGIIDALGKSSADDAPEALRQIVARDKTQLLTVARSLATGKPQAANLSVIVLALEQAEYPSLLQLVTAVQKTPGQPKPEEGHLFRAVLVASSKLKPEHKWKAVEILRKWTNGKQFGAEMGDWKDELGSWAKWFGQTYPKEPTLPNVTLVKPAEGKYKYDELIAFLTKEPAGLKGDAVKGKAVFAKALCSKCHKYGTEGEGVGPDLSTVSKRFNRTYLVESLIYPSKVISDQYRSTMIQTKKGQSLIGLAAVQGDDINLLQQDATIVKLKKGDIDAQFASLVSVMPEKLLDTLSKEEIADLFAYLESDPGVPTK
jgi:putative heme-binding domain-containing protein